ncbi:pentapeptide repeat-containing protein [Candidatus Chazhemtobacterium aquaticus]|uniref:Pentapeptide repeat-containing protein n=1 Tax=Candidatus Chazhemtobacterium aquaticus TaxID=2715735 RepID=A0A857N6A4_9BACT|nr:pentapeptide repeat-containing protein [Candidatus Chazhemtobacterium aquaticus]QHO63626.1 hypothetical protein MICH65_0645 [Candidatus Chazhemtobacterium aquaticus]
MIWKSKHIGEKQLVGVRLVNDSFLNLRFAGVELKLSSFEKCLFKECDFSGVIIQDSGFIDVDFQGSRISNLDLSVGYFKGVKFDEVVAEGTVFRQLRKSDEKLEWMDMRKTSFVKADLSSAIFMKCRLNEADFRGAKLERCVFEGCDLSEANFSEAQLAGVNFEGSRIDKTVLDMSGFVSLGQAKGFVLSD